MSRFSCWWSTLRLLGTGKQSVTHMGHAISHARDARLDEKYYAFASWYKKRLSPALLASFEGVTIGGVDEFYVEVTQSLQEEREKESSYLEINRAKP